MLTRQAALLLLLFTQLIVCPGFQVVAARQLDVQLQSHAVVITSRAGDNSTKASASYRFQFTTSHLPNFRVASLKRDNDSAEGFTFRIGLLALVEYNETIPVGQSRSLYSFIGKGGFWSNINQTQQGQATKFTTMFSGNDSIPISKNPLTVNLTAYVAADNNTVVDGLSLAPTHIKYSLAFENFSYQYQNSSIAFLHGLFTSTTEKRSFNSKQPTVPITVNDTGAGDFSWNPNVIADGRNVTLDVDDSLVGLATQTIGDTNDDTLARRDETLQLVAFKVGAVQPKSVLWDPSLGVKEENNSPAKSGAGHVSGSNNAATSLFALFVLLVSAILLF